MSLTSQLAHQVASAVRRRGRSYFMRGAVQINHGDSRGVQAVVRGTRRYRVRLSRHHKTLQAACNCPYYESNAAPCKHIWATVLAAEEHGLLLDPSANGRLRLLVEGRGPDRGPDRRHQGGANGVPGPHPHHHPGPQHQPGPPPPGGPAGDGMGGPGRRRKSRRARKRARQEGWKQQLAGLRESMQAQPGGRHRGGWPSSRQLIYVVDVTSTDVDRVIAVEIAQRQRKRDGEWTRPRTLAFSPTRVTDLPDPADRQILGLLAGPPKPPDVANGTPHPPDAPPPPPRYTLTESTQDMLLPLLCGTGRCRLRVAGDQELRPLRWDGGPPWEFWLEINREPAGRHYVIVGGLRRGHDRMPLTAPVMLVPGGLVFYDDRVARLEDFGAFDWIALLRKQRSFPVPVGQADKMLNELLRMPRLPRLELPPELHYDEVAPAPLPRLRVRPGDHRDWGPDRLVGELSFDYDGLIVPADEPGRAVYQPDRRRLVVRDQEVERSAFELLTQLDLRPGTHSWQKGLGLAPRSLQTVVRVLLEAGWYVEAEGRVYRRPGAFHMNVSSGIDWFELHGRVDFGDTTASLPELLAALRRGDDTIRLDDGTVGLIPEEWLRKYGVLAELGSAEGDHLRFARSQVGVLDALLASQPGATCDEVFARARDELRRFEGVQAADPPAGFVGELRAYQRDGLGWLGFLQHFGFGGCLADDMGLGKTVQVLALLEERRERRAAANGDGKRLAPSLVVVPKSLVFNWKQEAARFAPQIRILDHTGAGRSKPSGHFGEYDVVLTTYGTLRRDAAHFKDVRFDYCILDEAQAIKNAGTESAKAARLLRADHRLALSGTPVENHLGELWSLFEFLNPGMLGAASVFQRGGAAARNPDPEARALLARALRPFILRRTKEQVAKDLPQRLEQTLYCELEPPQRKQYDQLRDHYRRALLPKIEHDGLSKSKILILEALLRLRQAACHPGLIDKDKTGEPSAKLEVLLEQIAEVLDEGHKALVFSQFTSMLAIVRERLDEQGIVYEYLDGRTRNRSARVERFQTDPDCKLFLISLKAGGLGLNLTAADYVFLLDPWWNPAVEAQAIDRAHRIGQTRPVFAYRLIAQDTVEEKVLALQQSKRELADAIINADNSLIRDLSREDLALLLS